MGGLEFAAGAAAMALNFPLYVSVGVTDPAAAERVLSYTAARLARQRPRGGGFDFRVLVYRVEPYRGRKIHVVEGVIGPVRFRGFISILGYEAYLTPRLSVLKKLIDLAEEGQAAEAQDRGPWGNVALVIRPKAWRKVKDDFQLAWAATAREACISNLDELQVLFKYFSDIGMPIEKVAEKADGTRYFCPEGGEYQYDAEKNLVACTVHGTKQRPRQPERMREDAAFSRLINGIDQITVSLAFQSEGVRTLVRMKFKDHYRPFAP